MVRNVRTKFGSEGGNRRLINSQREEKTPWKQTEGCLGGWGGGADLSYKVFKNTVQSWDWASERGLIAYPTNWRVSLVYFFCWLQHILISYATMMSADNWCSKCKNICKISFVTKRLEQLIKNSRRVETTAHNRNTKWCDLPRNRAASLTLKQWTSPPPPNYTRLFTNVVCFSFPLKIPQLTHLCFLLWFSCSGSKDFDVEFISWQ